MDISKNESFAIKGLVITTIVLHNIVHVVQGVKCNEFAFLQENVDFCTNNIFEMPYTMLISFWGWLGVPIFFFLSGYGLQKSYSNIPNWKIYLYKHAIKLIILMLPAFLLFILLTNTCFSDKLTISQFFQQVTFLINIIHPERVNPGPYWYLGVTLQFYIIFYFLRKLSNKNLIIIAFLIFVGIIVLTALDVDIRYIRYIRKNCIGWFTTFIIGMLMARTNKKLPYKGYVYMVIGSLLLIIATSFSKLTWVVPEIAVIFFAISCIKLLPNNWFSKLCIYIGSVSASVYVVHPILRNLWFKIHFNYDTQCMTLMISLTFFIIAVLFSIGYQRLYTKMLKITSKNQPS